VQNQQFTRPVALSSLCDDLLRTGHRPRTDMLAHETVAADDRVAAALQVPTGTDIVHLRRLRWAREVPIAIMCNWPPTHLATVSAEDLVTQGLYELLRRTGVQMRIARQRIGARAATPEENRVLREYHNAPLLTMERLVYDDAGRAVELGSHVYPADTYSFEITLVDP
jgi:DNA-binding GntR family transcriptional regulator